MKDYRKQLDLEKVYESTIRNTGKMSAPDASKITPGINRDSGFSQNIYTPNDYRIGENEEGEKETKVREALKKIKEILNGLDL
jgi:hypothetical protein